MTPPNPARAACGSVRTDDLPDRLRTVAALLHKAACEVDNTRRTRDCAVQGHEGQTRNTLAFMRERDALADRITRALAILDTAPDPVSTTAVGREAFATLANNNWQVRAILRGEDKP